MLFLNKTKDVDDSKFYFSEIQTQERDKGLKGTERRKKEVKKERHAPSNF